MEKNLLNLPVIIYYDEDTYIAKCPIIQGAFAEGDTPEEALKELMDVIKMIIAYKKERNEKLENLEEFISKKESKICTSIPISF
jgi:predicted RNase H-like HicB family nuclease